MLTDGTRKGPVRLPKRDGWMIEDVIVDLFWSNSQGWVDRQSADVFTDAERESLRLPYGGRWVSMQELHEQRVESMGKHPSTWADDEKPTLRLVEGGAS
jgi:hypothetical protein